MLELLRRVLGDCTVEADRSWAHGGATVLLVRDARGARWAGKHHRDRDRYRAECDAYRRWVPALGDRAPRLRFADDATGTLVLSAVPGAPDWSRGLTPAVQRRAGAALRRLHDAAEPQPWPEFAAVRLAEFDRWAPAAAELLPAPALAAVRAAVLDLADLPVPHRVPCHGDYTPRNWVLAPVDGAGGDRFAVIDFEWSGRDVWVADLARLAAGPWREDPELAAAFLAGYGRALGAVDRAMLLRCAAVRAVFLAGWGHRHGEVALERSARDQFVRLATELRPG
jgi:Ser/Thr protein kinase RdoA (MazF antagonist)